ncbi:MAG: Gfo/Idh/MocA family oxidoreductase [Propionibacteriaceae bacterium]|jgi:predicted dehydrogenase|nr:Gfo/Idh/MocA family oxidoreductase [Propionibacteriaceae bacterium]
MTDPIRFAAIGTGWRTEFFLRVAKAVPEQLQVAVVVGRTASSIQRLAEQYGVATSLDVADLASHAPEFVAASVPWAATPSLTAELAEAGYHVYCETPPAPDLAGLRALWERVGSRAELIQIGEQYYRMPGHAARLSVVRDGVIGRPNSVEIASTHMYHAVALIRDYLAVGMRPAVARASKFSAGLLDPLTFNGWVENPVPQPRTSTVGTLDFGDGQYGLYNFVDNQWWNPLLSRRIAIRGSNGEIVDNTVLRLVDGDPVTSAIEYRRVGVDMSLEGNEVIHASFDGKVIYRNQFRGSYLSEDDIAVADHLVAMGKYVRGEGPAPYPLADGCQDHALALAIEESATSGQPIPVQAEPWTN